MARMLFLITVLVMFTVSAAAEISLFLSFTQTGFDKLLASLLAGGMVLAQLLFADQAAMRKKAGQNGTAFFCGAMAALLLLISVIGTVVFFESRYQQQITTATQNSDSYQLQKQLVQQSLESAAQLKKRAAEAQQLNRISSAMQLTRQAAEIEQASAGQIASLGTQGAAVQKSLSEWRWGAWLLFAAVADLIGTFGVVLLRTWPAEKQNTKPAAETKQATETKPETKQAAPVKQNTKQAVETKQPVAKNQTEVEYWMHQQIKTQRQVPAVRDAKARGYTYGDFTRAVQRMIEQGFITPRASGKGWDVVSV